MEYFTFKNGGILSVYMSGLLRYPDRKWTLRNCSLATQFRWNKRLHELRNHVCKEKIHDVYKYSFVLFGAVCSQCWLWLTTKRVPAAPWSLKLVFVIDFMVDVFANPKWQCWDAFRAIRSKCLMPISKCTSTIFIKMNKAPLYWCVSKLFAFVAINKQISKCQRSMFTVRPRYWRSTSILAFSTLTESRWLIEGTIWHTLNTKHFVIIYSVHYPKTFQQLV